MEATPSRLATCEVAACGEATVRYLLSIRGPWQPAEAFSQPCDPEFTAAGAEFTCSLRFAGRGSGRFNPSGVFGGFRPISTLKE